MNRLRVALLVLILAPLVFDGSSVRAPSAMDAADAEGAGLHAAVEASGPTTSRSSEVYGDLDRAAVAAHVERLNPSLTDRQVERIARAVLTYSEKYQLDPALVLGVITQESAARPWARSPKGAIGLMQVMPYMKGSLDLAGNLTTIESNIEAGCIILSDNIRRLGERRGILAYFWGNEIRGVRYWERVEEARAAIRRQAES